MTIESMIEGEEPIPEEKENGTAESLVAVVA